jgi:hypothetical protein
MRMSDRPSVEGGQGFRTGKEHPSPLVRSASCGTAGFSRGKKRKGVACPPHGTTAGAITAGKKRNPNAPYFMGSPNLQKVSKKMIKIWV